MRICFYCRSTVDMTPALRSKLARWVKRGMRRFPDVFEGVITLAGVQHFVTCKQENGVAVVHLADRELAEELLNEHGLRPGRTHTVCMQWPTFYCRSPL